MNLGPEHVGQKRSMYNLDGVLADESPSKEKGPGFLRAIVHLMPDSMVDDLDNVANTKSMKA
eukprot:4276784-Karenia_brevis.AAC.1